MDDLNAERHDSRPGARFCRLQEIREVMQGCKLLIGRTLMQVDEMEQELMEQWPVYRDVKWAFKPSISDKLQ